MRDFVLKSVRRLCVLPLLLAAASTAQNSATTSPADPMQSHYEAANRFLNAGDQQNAGVEYRAFLAEALHRVANAEAQTGRIDAAISIFEKAVYFAPSDNALRLDFASALLDAERLAQAKDMAAEAVRSDPRNARARLLLGRIFYHLDDYQQAKPQLEAAVGLNPDFETGYLLGKTYLLLHDQNNARHLFDEMVAGLGDTALLHTYFARAYSLMDYPEQAIEEFRKAAARDPHARDVHYYWALAYLRHDETVGYDKAIPEFQAELAINPSDVRSHYMLGYIALKQRRLAEAESELKQAEAIEPNDLNTIICLAETYIGENRTADAEAALRKAVAVAGSSEDARRQAGRAHYLLGRLLMKAGRTEEARQQFRLAAEDGSDNANAEPAGEARTISSSSLVQQESRERSDPLASAASPEEQARADQFKNQLAPLIAESYNNLGALAASHRDFKSAVEMFEQVQTWNPAMEGLDRNLGMAAFYAGEFDKAQAPLQHYLAAHPDDRTVRSALDEVVKKQTSGNTPRPN
jgi:tetratricopeptide (TPR) repeat protein